MRQTLSSFLCLHWAAAFAILAFVCVDGQRGVETALGLIGIRANGEQIGAAGSGLAIPVAVVLLLVAVLFCWASVESFVGDTDRPPGGGSVIKAAFTGAGLLLSVTLVAGTTAGLGGVFATVAVQIAALAACYLACVGERLGNARLAGAARSNDSREAARTMAMGAARVYTRPRLAVLPSNHEGR